MDVVVSSDAFVAGSPIPVDNTCDGRDVSPPVNWTTMPQATTKSVAIVFDDGDANDFTHWLAFNIPPTTHSLAQGAQVSAATNDFDRRGYNGPCPPKGTLHHYRLTVYGLDTTLAVEPQDKRDRFDRMMNGHVVAKGQLLGTFLH